MSDAQDEHPKEQRSPSVPASVSSKSSRQSSPRKRKFGQRSTQSSRNTSSSARSGPRPARHFPTEEWTAEISDLAVSTARYVIDVLGGGISLLRKPLSFLVFLWLFLLLCSYISSAVTRTLRPLCFVPGIRSTSLCMIDSSQTKLPKSKGSSVSPKWADYPGLMNAQSLTFEQLLDDSVGGSGLSLDIKKAEMATSDLITLVKFSKLTSKELLGMCIRCFWIN